MKAVKHDRLSAEARREAIVHAAAPLFADKGFDAVTTREVAEAAGVSEALLYRHFDSKAALYEAIQMSCILDASEDAQKLEALPDSTATLVLACYLVMAKIQLGSRPGATRAHIPRLILRSLLTDGEFTRGFSRATTAKWIGKIERCIRAGCESGEIELPYEEAFNSVWFAHHIACSVVFYGLPGESVIEYPGAPSPEAVLDQSVRFALRGLGLTKQAIDTYYNRDAFALLRNAGPRD
jgi:AcrR family transcriptional regulator